MKSTRPHMVKAPAHSCSHTRQESSTDSLLARCVHTGARGMCSVGGACCCREAQHRRQPRSWPCVEAPEAACKCTLCAAAHPRCANPACATRKRQAPSKLMLTAAARTRAHATNKRRRAHAAAWHAATKQLQVPAAARAPSAWPAVTRHASMRRTGSCAMRTARSS